MDTYLDLPMWLFFGVFCAAYGAFLYWCLIAPTRERGDGK